MRPATAPRDDRARTRLLLLDPQGHRRRDAEARDLPRWLRPGDLLIVNDAATLPASLRGERAPRGPEDEAAPLELRLTGAPAGDAWRAILFGAGDWRTPTERRPEPPRVRPGDRLSFGPDLSATVIDVSPISPRLIELRWDREGPELWAALYRRGRPVQYAYARDDLALWSVQTVFAGRPWAAEMPSAGRPLDWETLLALRRRGVEVAALTHAAGLSSTGDAALDAALPLRERFEIPADTIAAIARARARGGRVIAVGTTVVRALEGCARARGELSSGPGETDLILGPGLTPRVVDGILTGMHGPGESHFELLQIFAGAADLRDAFAHADAAGYLAHEFGDAALILPGLLPA